MPNLSILQNQKVFDILKIYNVVSADVFGSYVKGTQNSNSDVDILVNFKTTPNLFEFVELKQELERVIGLDIDLATENSLDKYLKPEILSTKVNFYELSR